MDFFNTLFISDLDGTLLDKNAELSVFTAKALNELIAKGVHFSVATARTPATACNILSGLDLRVPAVMMNGVLVYDLSRDDYLKINYLPPDAVADVTSTLRTFGSAGLMYELAGSEMSVYYETLENEALRDFTREREVRYGKRFTHTESFSCLPSDRIVYFTLLDKRERLEPVYAFLSARPGMNLIMYRDIYSDDLWFLEIYNAVSSKRNAVLFLKEEFGYGRVVGFGDNLNDLPMFEACDVKIAVENASPEVKAAADYICGANDKDGVVKWLMDNL